MSTARIVEELELKGADEFVDQLRPTNPDWGSGWDCLWVFRGHADALWKLAPSARRIDGLRTLRPILEETLKRFSATTFEEFERAFQDEARLRADDQFRVSMRMLVQSAETYALQRFGALADELGLDVEQYKDNADRDSEEPSPLTALAQHHGVPTRLLDWTRRPLHAAYFASCENCDAPAIAVWALNVHQTLVVSDVKGPWGLHGYSSPRFAHRYLHAQDGLFTWTKQQREDNYLISRGHWPSVPELLEHDHPAPTTPLLRKFTLPRSEVPALRRLLWRERVSKAHMMPTFDNVASSLFERWRVELPACDGTGLPDPVIWRSLPADGPFDK